MGPLQGVLFDFGGTLFGHEPFEATVGRALRSCGAEVGTPEVAALAARIHAAAHRPEELALGRDLDPEVWRRRWQVLYGAADEVATGAGAALYRLMHEPAEWHPFARAGEVLAVLQATGVRIGVLSNTGWDVRTVFEHWDLARYVDAFTLSYEVGAVKPSPEAFRRAFAAMGVDPSVALMVGDDPTADSGAVVVGARTLLLPAARPGADNGLGAVLAMK